MVRTKETRDFGMKDQRDDEVSQPTSPDARLRLTQQRASFNSNKKDCFQLFSIEIRGFCSEEARLSIPFQDSWGEGDPREGQKRCARGEDGFVTAAHAFQGPLGFPRSEPEATGDRVMSESEDPDAPARPLGKRTVVVPRRVPFQASAAPLPLAGGAGPLLLAAAASARPEEALRQEALPLPSKPFAPTPSKPKGSRRPKREARPGPRKGRGSPIVAEFKTRILGESCRCARGEGGRGHQEEEPRSFHCAAAAKGLDEEVDEQLLVLDEEFSSEDDGGRRRKRRKKSKPLPPEAPPVRRMRVARRPGCSSCSRLSPPFPSAPTRQQDPSRVTRARTGSLQRPPLAAQLGLLDPRAAAGASSRGEGGTRSMPPPRPRQGAKAPPAREGGSAASTGPGTAPSSLPVPAASTAPDSSTSVFPAAPVSSTPLEPKVAWTRAVLKATSRLVDPRFHRLLSRLDLFLRRPEVEVEQAEDLFDVLVEELGPRLGEPTDTDRDRAQRLAVYVESWVIVSDCPSPAPVTLPVLMVPPPAPCVGERHAAQAGHDRSRPPSRARLMGHVACDIILVVSSIQYAYSFISTTCADSLVRSSSFSSLPACESLLLRV